jgi:hypothetical protein
MPRNPITWLFEFLFGSSIKPKKIEAPPSPQAPQSAVKSLLFSVPISQIYDDESLIVNGVPKPVHYAAEALQDWLKIEGLFRVSGIFGEMNRMKATFEKGEIPDFANVDSRHSIAGLLEMWFRELPEPITTFALYDDFILCVSNDKPEEESIELIRACIDKLPPQNKVVLSYFLRFMHRVAEEEEENKMGAKNLGVVFGSILLNSSSLVFSLEMKQLLTDQGTVVQRMIANVNRLFPEGGDEIHELSD